MPIDILFGRDRLRTVLDRGGTADEVLDGTSEELAAFERATAPYLLYP